MNWIVVLLVMFVVGLALALYTERRRRFILESKLEATEEKLDAEQEAMAECVGKLAACEGDVTDLRVENARLRGMN